MQFKYNSILVQLNRTQKRPRYDLERILEYYDPPFI